MSDQKAFYEIEKPKRKTATIIHLIDVNSEVDDYQCMHTVYSRRAAKKRCSESTEETCAFCGMWTCSAHFVYSTQVWIEDNSGFNGTSGYHASPCMNCARFSKDDLLKLRALRLELNWL